MFQDRVRTVGFVGSQTGFDKLSIVRRRSTRIRGFARQQLGNPRVLFIAEHLPWRPEFLKNTGCKQVF
jgi:hypothetical protein